ASLPEDTRSHRPREHTPRRRPSPGSRAASDRIGRMARFFDLDEANETIPELRTILETLRDERSQLIAVRDECARRTALETAPGDASAERAADDAAARTSESAAERRALRPPSQGALDQSQRERRGAPAAPPPDAGRDRPDAGRRRPDRRAGRHAPRDRDRPRRLPGPRR